ncbi:MAG TPA: hypothetical protein VFW96_06320 [Thermomicrobiales bacterium]|nr:hypothetical protein [Thermomicrobiales bacterium]
MKHVGIREFRDRATRYLASNEVITIERHGTPIGYFIPIRHVDEEEGRLALARLRDAVDRVLAESGMTKGELGDALDLNRPFDDAPGR